MFDLIYQYFSYDLGIDLGTANTLVLVKNEGIKIKEPSVIAINVKTKEVLAVGTTASKMFGKTPPDVSAIRPLKNGVISDFEATVKMLNAYIKKVHQGRKFSSILEAKPKIVVGIPSAVTEVEKRAVSKAVSMAGARQCFLVDEPMAAAIGAGLKVWEPSGSFIIDIGGGTCEIGLISLGGIVCGRSIKIAGEKFDDDIVDYVRKKHSLIIGPVSAEQCRISAGSAFPIQKEERKKCLISGRSSLTGLPKALELGDEEIAAALKSSLGKIVLAIKDVLDEAPPELVSDIEKRGIVLAGGGCLLDNLDIFLSAELETKVTRAADPQTCVVRGCGYLLENSSLLKRVSITA